MEGNISLLFFPKLHAVRRMSDPAQRGWCCVWEFKAREDGRIDGLLCTNTCSQSGFVPMILYHSKVSRASGHSQVRASIALSGSEEFQPPPKPSKINALGRHRPEVCRRRRIAGEKGHDWI